MKKILLAMLLVLLTAVSALAAGTVTESVAWTWADQYGAVVVLKFEAVGDASDGSVPDHVITNIGQVKPGYYLYQVECVPGTGDAEPTAYTVDVKDADGFSIVNLDAQSATAKSITGAHTTTGVFPVITSALTLDIGDLGASDEATIYLMFVK